MELTIKNPDMNNVEELFYAYIVQHNKKYENYRFKSLFKVAFNDNLYSTFVKSNLFDRKTMSSWQKFLGKVIDDFKNNV